MSVNRMLRNIFTCALLMLCLGAVRSAGAQRVTDIEFTADPVYGGESLDCYVFLDSPAGPYGEWIYLTALRPDYGYFPSGGSAYIWIPPGYYYYYTPMYTNWVPSRRYDWIFAVPWGYPRSMGAGRFLTIDP
jgi:hypothetical protein